MRWVSIIFIKVISENDTFNGKLLTPTPSLNYTCSFLVMVEGLRVAVILRTKPSRVFTPVRPLMAVRSRKRGQIECDQQPKTPPPPQRLNR